MQYLACTLPVPGCSHKTEQTDVIAWCQAELLTVFVLICPEMLSLKYRLREECDRIMEH